MTKQFADLFSDMGSLEGIWLNQRLVYNVSGDVIGRIEMCAVDEFIVNVNLIAIYPEYRKQGLFAQIVNLIARTADKYGFTINLIPMATESKEIPASDISTDKLKAIYTAHGFIADHDDMEISNFTRLPFPRELNSKGIIE